MTDLTITLNYEFGGDDDHCGEDFEYEVSYFDAYRALLDDFFGKDLAKKVYEFFDELVDPFEIVDNYMEMVEAIFEKDAYDVWKNGIKCGRE